MPSTERALRCRCIRHLVREEGLTAHLRKHRGTGMFVKGIDMQTTSMTVGKMHSGQVAEMWFG